MPTDKIKIVAYNAIHKNEVIQLLRLNTPKYFAPEEANEFSTFLDQQIELYYIMLFDDIIIGCGGINFTDNHTTAIMTWAMIHPEYQGKGFGSKLMSHRLEKINTMPNIRKICVRTAQLTYKFYQKQGFVLLDTKKDYWAKGLDLYYMEFDKTTTLLN